MGIIALDIDGTITNKDHLLDDSMVEALTNLHKDGHTICFITGRSLAFTSLTLHPLKFPYYLGLQNGADILHMPDKRIILQNYFEKEVLQEFDKLYKDLTQDFIVYSGYKTGDFCYFRPQNFSQECLEYLTVLQKLTPVQWQEVESFNETTQTSFPLLKCFGTYANMEKLNNKLHGNKLIDTCLIKDPIDPKLSLILVTKKGVNKGHGLSSLITQEALEGKVIAAGDDSNDLPLLQRADVKIAIDTAPDDLKDVADMVVNQSDLIKTIREALL